MEKRAAESLLRGANDSVSTVTNNYLNRDLLRSGLQDHRVEAAIEVKPVNLMVKENTENEGEWIIEEGSIAAEEEE